MGKVLVDDIILDRPEARVDIEDRGYQFGDGVYEVIRIYDGKLFTVEEHLERFFESAEKIKMSVPFEKSKLLNLLRELMRENGVNEGSIYMQLTRGASPRNHVFPNEEIKPILTAYTKVVARPIDVLEKGVEAIILDDIRWLRCDIKSLNLLPNILAKQSAAEKGCFEAILHRNGTVTEGSSSNVYIVKNGYVQTHPATNLILNGITRQVVLRLCEKNNIPFKEEPIQLSELLKADEVFMTSTTSEVMPIISIDKNSIGEGHPGPITKKLQLLFEQEIKMVREGK